MYKDNTTNNNFPKTLLIRNTIGGLVWQVYHVINYSEAKLLSNNAKNNGFLYRQLVDYDEKYVFQFFYRFKGYKNRNKNDK